MQPKGKQASSSTAGLPLSKECQLCRRREHAKSKPAGARPAKQAKRTQETTAPALPPALVPAPASAATAAATAAEHEEVVEEAEGLRLHLSSTNATGYKCVCREPQGSQSRPYRVRTPALVSTPRMNLGSFATAVEAAVSYAQHVQSQEEAKQEEEEEQQGEEEEQGGGEQVGSQDESAAQAGQAARVFDDSSEDEAQIAGDATQIAGDATQIAGDATVGAGTVAAHVSNGGGISEG